MHVSFTKAFDLAIPMVFLIATITIVDAAAIGSPGEPKNAGSTDLNEKEPSSHSVNKRSPFNPLFPVKVPATYLVAELYGLAGGKIIGKIPGIGLLQELLWGKKVLASKGK